MNDLTIKQLNNERAKKWYRENKERRREYNQNYYLENKDSLNKQNIENYYKNREKRRAEQKIYRAKNREIINARLSWLQADREFDGNKPKVLVRDEYQCTICGEDENLLVHHIDLKGKDYNKPDKDNSLNNLTTLCKSCHARYHTKHRWDNNVFFKKVGAKYGQIN